MRPSQFHGIIKTIATYVALTGTCITFAAETGKNQCLAQSGALRTPVVELYTSEGCSSCPPADQWLSTLKGVAAEKAVVVQAFHVGYWDYIGWVDRFASPAHTTRQRQLAAQNGLTSIYTPQTVLDGRDWRGLGKLPASKEPAGASIVLRQVGEDQFEAMVTPVLAGNGASSASWSAHWTVTEHGHQSKVKAGENAGELLQHDFVVRQYTPVGPYTNDGRLSQKLVWRSISTTPGHTRQVNLVVFDAKSGRMLQAVSANC